jgi:hypothetical protein
MWFKLPVVLIAIVLFAGTSYSLKPLIGGVLFSQTCHSRTLFKKTRTHLFAQRDSDKKITRDKEGDYFQSEVRPLLLATPRPMKLI